MASRTAGTGMLMKRALPSRDTKVSSGATLCSLRDLANPLLFLMNEKLLPQYSSGILLRISANL